MLMPVKSCRTQRGVEQWNQQQCRKRGEGKLGHDSMQHSVRQAEGPGRDKEWAAVGLPNCSSGRAGACALPPPTAPAYRSNIVDTAAAVNASACSCPPAAPPLACRCLGSESGVAAGGFQSASAASELLPHADTWPREGRRDRKGWLVVDHWRCTRKGSHSF